MIYPYGDSLPGPGDEATWGPCTNHPNDPRTPISIEDEIAELRSQRKEELIEAAMAGLGPFWSTDMRDADAWDGEQQHAIAATVGSIMRMPTLKPETRWQLLMETMRKGCVAEYADIMVGER